jgi:hypothetical protein
VQEFVNNIMSVCEPHKVLRNNYFLNFMVINNLFLVIEVSSKIA